MCLAAWRTSSCRSPWIVTLLGAGHLSAGGIGLGFRRVCRFSDCNPNALVEITNSVLNVSGLDVERLNAGEPDAFTRDKLGSLATLCKNLWDRCALEQFEFDRKK